MIDTVATVPSVICCPIGLSIGTAEDLHSVYQKLGSRMQMQTRETELTAMLALLAAILILAGSSLSVLWFRRIA